MEASSLVLPGNNPPASTAPLNLLLTPQSALTLVFLAFLALGPAKEQNDIIAAVFAFSLAGIVVTFLGCCLISGSKLERNLSLGFNLEGAIGFAPSSSAPAPLLSGEVCSLLLRAEPFSLLPLYKLDIQIRFKQEGVSTAIHRFTGRSGQSRISTEQIIFPHRGRWVVESVRAEFSDILGFSKYTLLLHDTPAPRDFVVHPKPEQPSPLPVVSSSARSGDALPDLTQREGDPYDLKPYHPSDGMRKILWKVFAKSGQLIARHPEKSMTPEGQVIIYVLASAEDDQVCSAAISYSKKLEELNLEIFLSCLGNTSTNCARSAAGSEDLLIESVWQAQLSTHEQLENEIEQLISSTQNLLRDVKISKVVCFAPALSSRPAALLEACQALGDNLQRRSIQPVFIVGPRMPALFKTSAAPSAASRLGSRLRRLIIEDASESRNELSDITMELGRICVQREWQIEL
ncbi:MAG: hypothetical protein DCC75_04435 [Proteobacteria bacterium]|nr:MAG: hypothetical protein DCC75_04435 [Pseudomonadota bacterium]